MGRYFGLIFIVVVGAIIYVVVLQAVKGGVFSDLAAVFKDVKFGFQGFSTSSPNQFKPSQPTPPAQPPPSEIRSNIQPPAGFTIDQISPYYDKIQISSVSRDTIGGTKIVTQINLQSSYSLKETVDVSGWLVKSNKGDFLIPQAINNFDPLGYRKQSDIMLGSNSRVYIHYSSSPLGPNFRLNKCTGYLNNFYKFKPELPKNCPSVDRREIVALSGKCQNLVLSFGSCKIPSDKDLNASYVLNEPACRAFLDKLNYRGCYDRYYLSPDFLSNEWRVWLGKSIHADPEHDRIWLFDRQGLLVDEYVY